MDNIRSFRILYPSADNQLPDGEFAGYIGEHNATQLEITPPDEMSDCDDIATYRIAFELTNCRAVHSDAIPKATSIAMLLPSQITSSKVIAVQLEGYSADNNLVAKSEKMVKIKFHPSVCGVETGANNEPFGIVAEVTANTQARHKHSNAAVLDKLSDNGGILRYNGNPISGITVDSALSGTSANPVQNKVIKAKFDEVEGKIAEVSGEVSKNKAAIESLKEDLPDNIELLNRFSDSGVLLYNGIPVGDKPTASIELTDSENGIEGIADTSAEQFRLLQYQGAENGFPVGTKIETIEFLVNEKWIDIHGMAELDRVACSIGLYKVFPWDDYGANVLGVWSPINAVAREFIAYNIRKIRVTYSLPKVSFYVDGILHHVEYVDINSAVQHPEEPEKEGYAFLGWIPEGSTEAVKFPYTVSGEDIRFDASFQINEITIGFRDSFSSSAGFIHEGVYKYGDPLIPPEFEVDGGFVLLGWTNALGTEPESNYTSFAFIEENRMPSTVPDSKEVGDYMEYYPLYFEGGYVEAEEGYNDTANVWGRKSINGSSAKVYNIFVGGEGSLKRNSVNNKPWNDTNADGTINLVNEMIFGHGITEITDTGLNSSSVYLPSSLKKIHAGTFGNYPFNIYFSGTEEQWAAIEIGENNDGIANSTIRFNYPKIII